MFVINFEKTDWCKMKPIVFCSQKEWLEQENNLHINVTAKTYQTDHEMPCTSGARGRRKLSKPSTTEHQRFTGACISLSKKYNWTKVVVLDSTGSNVRTRRHVVT